MHHMLQPQIFLHCATMYLCVLHDSDIQQLSPSLHRLRVFVTETGCVTCEARTEYLYTTSTNVRPQDVKSGCLGSMCKRGDTNIWSLHSQSHSQSLSLALSLSPGSITVNKLPSICTLRNDLSWDHSQRSN